MNLADLYLGIGLLSGEANLVFFDCITGAVCGITSVREGTNASADKHAIASIAVKLRNIIVAGIYYFYGKRSLSLKEI